MKDFIEQKEYCAERQFEEMEQPNGKLKCFCGNIFDIDNGMILTNDPYAMPFCPECCEEFFKTKNNK